MLSFSVLWVLKYHTPSTFYINIWQTFTHFHIFNLSARLATSALGGHLLETMNTLVEFLFLFVFIFFFAFLSSSCSSFFVIFFLFLCGLLPIILSLYFL